MTAARGLVRFLASVTGEREAAIAVRAGADLIDCKNPAAGALGALPEATVAAVRAVVPRDVPVSATIGDLPLEAVVVTPAAERMAATGIEYVKVGLFPGGNAKAAIAALGAANLERARLVGVFLADREPDFALIEDMANAGFAGAMLDTAGKRGRSLLDCTSPEVIAGFVRQVKAAGMLSGLAGALRARHVPALMPLHPDILGFRGALCEGSLREGAMSAAAAAVIRDAISGTAEMRVSQTPGLEKSIP
jgi:(5-formylfuran-3-yl)methyl phosphate synthase